MSYRVYIIDDEKPARNLILEFLADWPAYQCAAEFGDGFSAAAAIIRDKPDLVFLDMRMPRMSGMEMLQLLDENQLPLVVFTTAYDEYAVKAFELHAADYLLKPIARERFSRCMQRVSLQLEQHSSPAAEIKKMIHQQSPPDESGSGTDYLKRILVREGTHIRIVLPESLFCLEARGDYVLLSTEKDSFLKKNTLQFFETRLPGEIFIRLHRSCIVNLQTISRIEPYSRDAWVAVLRNGRKLPVSRQGYAQLRKIMGSSE